MKTQAKSDAHARITQQVRGIILQLWPSMPQANVEKIVYHACAPNCRRIFSTDNKGHIPPITPGLVTRAVKAHVRHVFTDYDRMLVFHGKLHCRALVRKTVLRKMAEWRQRPTHFLVSIILARKIG